MQNTPIIHNIILPSKHTTIIASQYCKPPSFFFFKRPRLTQIPRVNIHSSPIFFFFLPRMFLWCIAILLELACALSNYFLMFWLTLIRHSSSWSFIKMFLWYISIMRELACASFPFFLICFNVLLLFLKKTKRWFFFLSWVLLFFFF